MSARGRVLRWDEARERLRRAAETTAAGAALPPERARALMDERARRLAAPAAATPDSARRLEMLCLSLGDERYGVETRHVREVVRAGDLTPVPFTPDFLLGVTNLRGELLAVVDLGSLFGLPPRAVTASSRVVVLGAERAEIGALADVLDDVTSIETAELLDAPSLRDGMAARFVRGVTAEGVVLIDAAGLLAEDGLFDPEYNAGGEPAGRGVS